MTGDLITTVEELDALPDDTILRGREGQAYLIAGRRVFGAGNDQAMAFREIEAAGLPATLLYRPDRPALSDAALIEEAARRGLTVHGTVVGHEWVAMTPSAEEPDGLRLTIDTDEPINPPAIGSRIELVTRDAD
jgi:hypothetical protein